MSSNAEQALLLYSTEQQPPAFDHLTETGSNFSILSANAFVETPHMIAEDPRVIVVDLTQCSPTLNNRLADTLGDSRFTDVSLVLLLNPDDIETMVPGLLAQASEILPLPIDVDAVRNTVTDYHRHYQQKKALSEDLNSVVHSLKAMTKGSFTYRTLSEAKSLSQLLSLICPNSSDAAVGLLELMINSIEHGNLEISFEEKGQLLNAGRWQSEILKRLLDPDLGKRSATIEFVQTPDGISFTISDEGPGFNVSEYLDALPQKPKRMSLDNFTSFHGRGIQVAKQICFDDLEYLGRGNQVKVSILRQADNGLLQ
ncbi:ATP-binding protein [Sneathiella aquimaris]|uniref:ATP-binding protein n=1 Tax=Sneathiella aquimaris TaxID=2599305 RepID=UPI00146A4EF9|nr:ATP-binding protein [Sneathiella aquimaris]